MENQLGWRSYIICTAASTVLAAIILILLGYLMDIPLLKFQVQEIKTTQEKVPSQISSATSPLLSRVAALEKQTAELDKKYALMAGFLQAKLNFNVQAFISAALKKGLNLQQIKVAVTHLSTNPKEGRNYLEKNLRFSPEEINAILSPQRQKNESQN